MIIRETLSVPRLEMQSTISGRPLGYSTIVSVSPFLHRKPDSLTFTVNSLICPSKNTCARSEPRAGTMTVVFSFSFALGLAGSESQLSLELSADSMF